MVGCLHKRSCFDPIRAGERVLEYCLCSDLHMHTMGAMVCDPDIWNAKRSRQLRYPGSELCVEQAIGRLDVACSRSENIGFDVLFDSCAEVRIVCMTLHRGEVGVRDMVPTGIGAA